MSVEAQFAAIQAEEREKGYRLEIARLRQVISCAICAECSDEIADQEWDLNDNERLVHKACRPVEQQRDADEQG